MKNALFVRLTSVFIALFICCTFVLCGAATPAKAISGDATGEYGWVEVQVSVPEDFEEHIFVTFLNRDTFESYSARLMAVNDYMMSFQLPVGRYKFDGAFLGNGDFRYNTELTNRTNNFTVTADAEKAVLVTLETKYNANYSDGAQASSPAALESLEPTLSDEEDSIDNSFTEDDSFTENPSASESDPVIEETFGTAEEPNEDDGSFLIDSDDSSLSVGRKLLYSLIGTASFIAVAALGVYFYRKHIEEN